MIDMVSLYTLKLSVYMHVFFSFPFAMSKVKFAFRYLHFLYLVCHAQCNKGTGKQGTERRKWPIIYLLYTQPDYIQKM